MGLPRTDLVLDGVMLREFIHVDRGGIRIEVPLPKGTSERLAVAHALRSARWATIPRGGFKGVSHITWHEGADYVEGKQGSEADTDSPG